MDLEPIWRYHLRLGDKYLGKCEVEHAIMCYLEAANHLMNDDYHSMAAAVYGQVLRLDDTRVDVRITLSNIYKEFHLEYEKQIKCRQAAALYDWQGKYSHARELIRIMLDLAPKDLRTAEELADLYHGS